MAEKRKSLKERIAEREAKREQEEYGITDVPGKFWEGAKEWWEDLDLGGDARESAGSGLLGAPAEDVAGAAELDTTTEEYQAAKEPEPEPKPEKPKEEPKPKKKEEPVKPSKNDELMAGQVSNNTPDNEKEYQEKIAALEAKITALGRKKPEQANQLKQDLASIDKAYEEERNRIGWAELAERIGHALTQLGAAYWGMQTGTDLSGIKFERYDWNKRRMLALQSMKGRKDSRLERARQERQEKQAEAAQAQRKQEAEDTKTYREDQTRLREDEIDVRRKAAGIKEKSDKQKATAKLTAAQEKTVRETTDKINQIFKSDQEEEEKLDQIERLMLSRKNELGLSTQQIQKMTEEPGWFWTGGSEAETKEAINSWLSQRSTGASSAPAAGELVEMYHPDKKGTQFAPKSKVAEAEALGWRVK